MNNGVPSAVIGVPARYIHGHQSLYTLADYQAAKDMLLALIRNFDQEALLTIKNA